MQTNKETDSGGTAHLDWVDAVRIVACVFVLMQHCSDPFYTDFNMQVGKFFAGVGIASLSRPAVPLFVMMTGLLLLPTRGDITSFYKKRITRIVVPLAFWSLVLPWIDFAWIGHAWSTTNPALDLGDYSLQATLRKCYTFPLNFNYSTTPFWYLYMLIGLYLVMPVLSGWLRQASKREIQVVLCVWLMTTLLPYIRFVAPLLGYAGNFGNMGLLGENDWNVVGTFYYMSGFVGYLLLGYYLRRYPLGWSMKRTLAVFVPLLLAGYAVTFGGYVWMNSHFPGQYNYLEIVWWTCGINVLMQTVSVFVIMQRWLAERTLPHVICQIAILAFGIFLVHFPVAQITFDLSAEYLSAVPAVLRIVVDIIATFVVSALIAKLFYSWRVTRRFVA